MSDDHNDGEQPPKSKRKAPSTKYANAPYEVGKGKPPLRSRFEPGNQFGRGRKNGSKNKHDYQDLLDERVQVGEDRAGRAIMKPIREVADRRFLQKVIAGEPWAMKIYMTIEQKVRDRITVIGEEPDPETLEKQRRLIEMMCENLDLVAELKHRELGDSVNGKFRLYGPGFPRPELEPHERPEPWSPT